MARRDGRCLGKRKHAKCLGIAHLYPQDGGGAWADGAVEVERACWDRRWVADPANLDEADTRSAHGMVVTVAVRALDDHLVACHRRQVGHRLHEGRIVPGDARRRAKQQSRRRTARDVSGLGAGDPGDDGTRGNLQVLHADVCPRCLGHGGQYFRRHARSTESRQGSRSVDDPAHA